MRFLLNMNVCRAIAGVLADLGQESVHARDVGLATADDKAVVEYARRDGRIIVTHDLDYGDLLIMAEAPRPSVLIFRLRRSSPSTMCQRLKEAWEPIRAAIEEGAIVVIEDAAVRIRSLSVEPQ
jgi:predicted nuclease of predicted toxin-antitoxin system